MPVSVEDFMINDEVEKKKYWNKIFLLNQLKKFLDFFYKMYLKNLVLKFQ